MSWLRVEVQRADGSWAPAGTLAAGDRPGSVTSRRPGGGRDVILFRCCGDYSLIERSVSGLDVVSGDGVLRIVGTEGAELLAELRDGQSHPMTITSDESGLTYQARWTHQGDAS